MLSPLSFLADELKQNGIAVDIPELIQHPAVLAELSYALSPVLHEGKINLTASWRLRKVMLLCSKVPARSC